MVYSRETAARRAEKALTNEPGMCQRWTRTIFNAPSVGDRDGDHDADAVDGWLSENIKHPGDRRPPRGVPVAFSGGSRGHGHRAVSLGQGKIRSTDMKGSSYSKGHVGTTTISDIEKAMGVKYLGWSEDISGIPIPVAEEADRFLTARCPVPSATFVLDISHHQTDNNFSLENARAQGYDFVILKCTQGVSYFDPAYTVSINEAKRLGMYVAVYHFLTAGQGDKQAANLAQHIGDKSIPVFIDFESNGTSFPSTRDAIIFKREATRLGLKVAGIYLTESYWKATGSKSLTGFKNLWRAAYPSMKPGTPKDLYPGNHHKRWSSFGGKKPILWQFTSSGQIPGYKGNLDVSAFRGTKKELVATKMFKRMGPSSKPVNVKPKASLSLFLAPGNKKQTSSQIRSDLKNVFTLGSGASRIVCSTERASAASRGYIEDVFWKDFYGYFENENHVSASVNLSVPTGKEPYSVVLAKADPSLAKVSPIRYLNVLPLESKELGFRNLVLMHTHLVSEAWCEHVNINARAWRQKTWLTQFEDIKREVSKLVSEGNAIILTGDFNTGKYFTGAKFGEELEKHLGVPVERVYGSTLDSVFVINGVGKISVVGKPVVKKVTSDHPMVAVDFNIT